MADCEDFRRIALGLPEVYEQDLFGGRTFRVAKKIFAQCASGHTQATLRLDRDHQVFLFELRPEIFSPAVWGKLVWTHARIDRLDEAEIEMLLTRAWSLVAPKHLAAKKP